MLSSEFTTVFEPADVWYRAAHCGAAELHRVPCRNSIQPLLHALSVSPVGNCGHKSTYEPTSSGRLFGLNYLIRANKSLTSGEVNLIIFHLGRRVLQAVVLVIIIPRSKRVWKRDKQRNFEDDTDHTDTSYWSVFTPYLLQ